MGLKETDHRGGECFTLTTTRLVLRRPRPADAQALAGIANDWDIASNLATMPHPYRLQDAKAFIDRVRPMKIPEISLLITTRGERRLIGGCSLRARDGGCDYHLGYWLGRQSWGQGFATEAVHCLVDFAFTGAKLKRLFVSCRVTNSASRRVIHKSGFQPDGTDMINSRSLGGSVPVEVFVLDRATWRALREWRREGNHAFS